MIRKSSCIFVLTLVILALVAAVGSIDNNRMIAGNNGVSDNEIVPIWMIWLNMISA